MAALDQAMASKVLHHRVGVGGGHRADRLRVHHGRADLDGAVRHHVLVGV